MSKKNLLKTFLLVFVIAAEAVSASAQTKAKRCFTPLGNLLAGIQNRADNLNYISEQDWDVNVFVIGRNISVLNAETFQAANPFIAYQPIEEIDVEVFFSRLEKKDAAWTNLRNYLEANLTQLHVFKAGNIRRDVYVVGLFQGHIVGIRTFAVET